MSRRMTVDEIALMRALVAWRKANEIVYIPEQHRYVAQTWTSSHGRHEVTWSEKRGEMGTAGIGSQLWRWMRVDSLTEAVGFLVVLGYLPARFSTAYSLGWGAGVEDAEHGSDHAKYMAVAPVSRAWLA